MRRSLFAATGVAAGLAAAGCGSTKTIVKVRTVTTVRTAREVTTIAAGSGSIGVAGAVAARFWTERVYTPAVAWKSLDPRQRSQIKRTRFVRCEGGRFLHTNEQQAQVDAVRARKRLFAGGKHAGWLVTLQVTIALNKGTSATHLLQIVVPVAVEAAGAGWLWRLDDSDVQQYSHFAKTGEAGCPE